MTYIREGIISYFPQYLSHTQTKEKEMNFYKYAGVGMTAWGLMLGGAYADSTIIASKAYVDSKVSGIDVSGAVATGTNALTISDSSTTAPSVTAVKGAASTTVPVTVSNGAATVTAGDNTHFITSGAVSTAFDRLDATGVDGSSDAATTANRGKPVVAVSQTNGLIAAELGQLSENGLADAAVVTAKLAAAAVTSDKIKTKNVKYAYHMDNESLFNINTGAAPASNVCVKDNPCMLTYYKEGGKVYTRWTPLETDSLSANVSVTSDGV